MSSRTICILSVVVMLIGVGMLTLFDPLPDSDGAAQFWVVPVAYFLTGFGAVGLCWGWFKGRKI